MRFQDDFNRAMFLIIILGFIVMMTTITILGVNYCDSECHARAFAVRVEGCATLSEPDIVQDCLLFGATPREIVPQ